MLRVLLLDTELLELLYGKSGVRLFVRDEARAVGVDAGDAYAISGKARWEVSHEVHAGTSDRLSVTVRYAGRDHV